MNAKSFRNVTKVAVLLLTLAMVLGVLLATPLSVGAASSHTQDGLKVTITTDKNKYAADEDIQVTVKIQNNNTYAVQEISVDTLLPEGLVLKDGSLSENKITVEAGGSYEISLVATLSDELKETEKETDTEKVPVVEEPQGTDHFGSGFRLPFSMLLIALGVLVLLIVIVVIIVVIVKKSKKAMETLCILLCAAMLLPMVPMDVFDVGADPVESTITVEKKVKVDGTLYTVQTDVKYYNFRAEDTIPPDDTEYTRSEWIALLAEKLDMDLSADAELIDYYYLDVRGDANAVAIELAQAYGLLPPPDVEDPEQDIPLFYPNAIADREFVAYTAVKAKGFEEHAFDASGWEDVGSVTYVDEAAIAVGVGYLTLSGNKFNPTDPITTQDIERIFTVFDQLDASTVVDPDDAHDNSVYLDGVVKDAIASIEDYSVEQDGDVYFVTMPLNSASNSISTGDVIVLPCTDTYYTGYSFRVDAISDYTGTRVLTCTVPQIEEVYEELDFAGNGTPLVGEFIPAEDVSCEYDANGSVTEDGEAYPLNINMGGTTKIPGTLKFTVREKKFSEFFKASGTVEVEIPEVACIVKASIGFLSGVKVKEFTFSVQEKIKIKGELEHTLAESGYELTNSLGNTRWEGGRVELGRLPIAIGSTGLSLDIVFFYNVEAKGTASISYTIVSKQGYQYKNGTGRAIFEFNDSMDLLELKGSAKAGLGIAADLCALKMFDLVGYSVEFGLGFNVSYTAHVLTDGLLHCGDVTLYAYATSGLDKETVVGKFLKNVMHYTMEFEHQKNPHKLKFHLENGSRVPECTLGTGSISGYIYSEGTRELLQDARVKLYSGGFLGTNLYKTVYTDASGKFLVDDLNPGEYRIVVSATGYMTYDSQVKVTANADTYLEAFMMIDRSNTEDSVYVSGTITDALTGYGLSYCNYAVRSGWENREGDVLMSGEFYDNDYYFYLPSGNYTLEVSKEGYITNYVNIAVGTTAVSGANVVLNPEGMGGFEDADGFRIVLTWGETPRDLDSHFYGPKSSGGTFHIYYSNKTYSGVADLDVDDTSSYGPETTTLHTIEDRGVYSFLVHDFTNRSYYESNALSMSGAKVQVYVGGVCMYTFNIPMNRVGNVWHVFNYDASTGALIPVNAFGCQESTSDILNYYTP